MSVPPVLFIRPTFERERGLTPQNTSDSPWWTFVCYGLFSVFVQKKGEPSTITRIGALLRNELIFHDKGA